MNRRSVTQFGLSFVSRLLAKMKGEVPAWLVVGFIAVYFTVAGLSAYRSRGAWRFVTMHPHGSEDDISRSNSIDLLRTIPGVVQPPVVAQPDVPWKGEDEVVGIAVNGRSRAYLVVALSRPDHHIINDMIGLVPVSITYCNINRCARAFTLSGAQAPLDIAVGGQHNLRELVLLVFGARFHQSNLQPYEPGQGPASFPLQNLPLTVTTWKRWKELHPDTGASVPLAPTSMRSSPRSARSASLPVRKGRNTAPAAS